MKAGILPRVLVEQVRSTAGWLWADPAAEDLTRVLDDVEAAEAEREAAGVAYSRLLFAAHYATVATFVPTDVDARIRHHAWMALEREDDLVATCDALDAIAKGDVHRVSARVVDSGHGTLSGHDGEWLSVRAGAIGRALTLGFEALGKRLEAAIDAELEREAAIFSAALAGEGTPERSLSIATTIAHNLGDLSRVVEAWPNRPELATLRARWSRLGHEESRLRVFATAGAVNKAVTANENHRFLGLRKPRGLRASRALLLPIGPWFDTWGETVAKALDDRDRAEVVTALLELHLAQPAQLGCLRALAGIHRATKGGLEVHVPDLPARIRKEALRGKVREAIDLSPERFAARMANRWDAERTRWR